MIRSGPDSIRRSATGPGVAPADGAGRAGSGRLKGSFVAADALRHQVQFASTWMWLAQICHVPGPGSKADHTA